MSYSIVRPDPIICAGCGSVATGELEDQGIGSNEYMGSVAYDVALVWIAECCGHPLNDEQISIAEQQLEL